MPPQVASSQVFFRQSMTVNRSTGNLSRIHQRKVSQQTSKLWTNVYAQFSRHHVNHTGTVATCGNSSWEVNTKVLSHIESMLDSSWPRAWLDSARAVVCCSFSSCFRWFLVSFVEEGSSTAPPDIFRSVRVTTSHFYAFLAKIVLPCSPRVLGGRLLVARILIVCVGMCWLFSLYSSRSWPQLLS